MAYISACLRHYLLVVFNKYFKLRRWNNFPTRAEARTRHQPDGQISVIVKGERPLWSPVTSISRSLVYMRTWLLKRDVTQPMSIWRRRTARAGSVKAKCAKCASILGSGMIYLNRPTPWLQQRSWGPSVCGSQLYAVSHVPKLDPACACTCTSVGPVGLPVCRHRCLQGTVLHSGTKTPLLTLVCQSAANWTNKALGAVITGWDSHIFSSSAVFMFHQNGEAGQSARTRTAVPGRCWLAWQNFMHDGVIGCERMCLFRLLW